MGGSNMKRLFIMLSIVGMIIISVCAFTIPNNPNEIIPALSIMSFDKPLWLCIIVGIGFIFLLVLWTIYDKITGNITKWCNEES